MASAKRKKSRKELLKEEDAFQVAANQSAQWFQDNKTAAIGGAVAMFLAIVAIWGGTAFLKARNLESSSLLQEAAMLAAAEVVTESDDTKADPTATPPTFASEEDRTAATLAKYKEAVASGSGVADLAGFAIGDLQENSEDYDGARATFAGLVDSLSTKDSLYFLAVERLAYLQEKAGDHDGAIKTLGRVAQAADTFYGDYASFHQARLYLAKGDTKRAQNLLEKVQKDYPTSPIKDEVDTRLEALGNENATVDVAALPADTKKGEATALRDVPEAAPSAETP